MFKGLRRLFRGLRQIFGAGRKTGAEVQVTPKMTISARVIRKSGETEDLGVIFQK